MANYQHPEEPGMMHAMETAIAKGASRYEFKKAVCLAIEDKLRHDTAASERKEWLKAARDFIDENWSAAKRRVEGRNETNL